MGLGTAGLEISPEVREALAREQRKDWQLRYGEGSGPEAVLLAARAFFSGRIIGTISVASRPYSVLGMKNPSQVLPQIFPAEYCMPRNLLLF